MIEREFPRSIPMMKLRRIQVLPYLPASLIGAYASSLTMGLAMYLGPGQMVGAGGAAISKMSYLVSNMDYLVRGVAIFGTPFGLIAWPLLSLFIPQERAWRNSFLIFALVAVWHIVIMPMDYMFPPIVVYIGPFAAFLAGLALCAYAERRKARSLQRVSAGEIARRWFKSIDAPLHADMPCAQCGYNLRMLQGQSACPECGLPMEETLRRAAVKPRTRSLWIFLPVSFAFIFVVACTGLEMLDMYLRFRNSMYMSHSLWGDKYLLLVMMATGAIAIVSSLVAWPLLWLALRKSRLLPSLALTYVLMLYPLWLSIEWSIFPIAAYVAFAAGLAICGGFGLFPLSSKEMSPSRT